MAAWTGGAALVLGTAWLLLALVGVVPPWRPLRLYWDGVAALGSELAWPMVGLGPLLLLPLLAGGALDTKVGKVGAAAMAGAVALLAWSLWQAAVDGRRLDAELQRMPGVAPGRPAMPFSAWMRPLHMEPDGIRTIGGVAYGPDAQFHRLDLLHGEGAGGAMPVLLHLHGGGFMLGRRNLEALPLLHHMARRGWLVATIDYRLSPAARWPAQVEDAKRAVAWLRENAARYGGDPTFIAVTGGSAGGTLAALLALAPGEAAWQPGFEAADTRVQAAVPFYGTYHLDIEGLDHVEQHVMPAPRAQAPAVWDAAAPARRVNADAPPFFVLHGGHDALAPVDSARRFVEQLRAVSREPVLYAELPAAVHGFDALKSPRVLYAVHAVQRFLEQSLARHRERQRDDRGPR